MLRLSLHFKLNIFRDVNAHEYAIHIHLYHSITFLLLRSFCQMDFWCFEVCSSPQIDLPSSVCGSAKKYTKTEIEEFVHRNHIAHRRLTKFDLYILCVLRSKWFSTGLCVVFYRYYFYSNDKIESNQ